MGLAHFVDMCAACVTLSLLLAQASPEAPPGALTLTPPEKSYLLPAGETFGLNLLVWGIARATLGQQSYDWSISFPQVLTQNPFRPWVWGKGGSSFDTSQFLHPLHGALEFSFARSAGLSFWESIWYPIGGSLMWELFMETNDPAINDEIVTPMGGIFFGEAFHRFADIVRGSPSDTWREIGAFLLNPAEGINHLAFHDEFWNDGKLAPTGYFQVSLGANAGGTYFDRVLGPANAAPQGFVRLDATEIGIGGYRAKLPFDDFDFSLDLAAGAGFSVQPSTDGNGEWDVFVRGLLVPARIDGGAKLQGLWGLWGTYDYGQPEVVRVSTVGLGPGATGQWDVRPGVSIVGSAVGAWVPFASADAITAPMLERDYHVGCGQGVVDLRLLLEDRLEIRGTLREYVFAAPIQATGWEQITRANVSVLGRVWDRHAVGLEWELIERDAYYPGEPDDFQRSALFRAYYTFVWDERLGAISLGRP